MDKKIIKERAVEVLDIAIEQTGVVAKKIIIRSTPTIKKGIRTGTRALADIIYKLAFK